MVLVLEPRVRFIPLVAFCLVVLGRLAFPLRAPRLDPGVVGATAWRL